MKEETDTIQAGNSTGASIKQIAGLILRNKWQILALVFLFFLAANVYLRYAKTVYEVTASLKIDIGSNGGAGGSQNADVLITFSAATQANEITSDVMLSSVAQRLRLTEEYKQKGQIKSTVLFKTSPIKIEYDTSNYKLFNQTLVVEFINNSEYYLYVLGNEGEKQRFSFDKRIKFKGSLFRINLLRPIDIDIQAPITVTVYSLNEITARLHANLTVVTGKTPDMLELAYRDEDARRAKAVLDTLLDIYLDQEQQSMERSVVKQLKYVESIHQKVDDSLSLALRNLETFEIRNEVPVMESSKDQASVSYLNAKEEIRLKLKALGTLETAYTRLKENAHKLYDDRYELGPLLFPESELQLAKDYELLKQTIYERNVLLNQGLTNRSNSVTKRNTEITYQTDNLLTQLENRIKAYKKELIELRDRRAEDGSLLMRTPQQIRGFEEVSGKWNRLNQQSKDFENKIFELNLLKASIDSRSKILKLPQADAPPISPRKDLMLYGSILLGLVFSLGYIFLRENIKNVISYRADIERLSNLPIIGEIARSGIKESTDSISVITHPKSMLTESFRLLRNNLRFLTNNQENTLIVFTSTISGEGKSFSSTNFAAILSLLDKKVLLIDLDLRKPRLHKIFNLGNEVGITTLLIEKDTLDDVIQPSGYTNLSFIPAGPIPPNPAELLNSDTFSEMLAELRTRFDYIVIDTSPVGMVTDALALLQTADVCLYMFRADFSKKSFLDYISRIKREAQIKKLYLIFNSVNLSIQKYGQGYGYGYGYGSTGLYGDGNGYYIESQKIPWWKKLIDRWLI